MHVEKTSRTLGKEPSTSCVCVFLLVSCVLCAQCAVTRNVANAAAAGARARAQAALLCCTPRANVVKCTDAERACS